ncbi:MAG: ribonuclease PH [Firmicutes bacterium]|nr:ribonuclease PH [Bacillota bacterium]
MRLDGRENNQLRPTKITRSYLKYAEGSALIEVGDTKVLCSVSVDDGVPFFLRGKGQGWLTAEYSLLPRSTPERTIRESSRGRISGRTHEIQRLIGRSLRSVLDMKVVGERTFWIDCDVLQADGGTRTASITGAFVALVEAIDHLRQEGKIEKSPILDFLASTSVGIVREELLLDLCFEEDSHASVDMNVIMTGSGKIVEVQGTAEGEPFSKEQMDELLFLATDGINQLFTVQKEALGALDFLVGVRSE